MTFTTWSFNPLPALVAATIGLCSPVRQLPRRKRPFEGVWDALDGLANAFRGPLGVMSEAAPSLPVMRVLDAVLAVTTPPNLLRGKKPVGEHLSSGRITDRPICPRCLGRTETGHEDLSVLSLPLRSMKESVVRLVYDRIRPAHRIIGGCCGICGQEDGMVAVKTISELPSILFLHLDRGTRYKEGAVDVPNRLFLDTERANYSLRAVIHRDLSTGEAEFTAALRLPGKIRPIKKKWYLMGVEDIACVEREQAVNPTTAYMLMYEKVSQASPKL